MKDQSELLKYHIENTKERFDKVDERFDKIDKKLDELMAEKNTRHGISLAISAAVTLLIEMFFRK